MIITMLTMTYLGILAMTDALRREIPVKALILGSIAATGVAGYMLISRTVTWEELLFGAVPGLFFLALAGFTKAAGAGDGIVLLQVNFVLFMDRVIMAFGISLIVMGLFSAILLMFHKGKRDTRLPYLPFLWLGCMGATCLCVR